MRALLSNRMVAAVAAMTLALVHQVSAQDASLASEITAVQTEIRKAEEEDQKYSGGLVKSVITLRLATLRQTLALLDQRAKAGTARTTLAYTVDGKAFIPPSDTAQQLAAVEKELADNASKLARQEAEAARYSGGLVQATALVTVATLRQSQAMLDQKRLALKYGLPQFVGFKDLMPSGATSISKTAPSTEGAPVAPATSAAAATHSVPVPADCMKQVFGVYCLGAPATTLPPNAARKTDDIWFYADSEPTAVTVVDGQIAVVGRFYTPGTWLTYQKVEGNLTEKYGNGKDLSFFPSYAKDSSSKETSISLQKGRAIRTWQQQGFTIQVKWENREHVALFYFHDALEAKRAAKKKDQF